MRKSRFGLSILLAIILMISSQAFAAETPQTVPYYFPYMSFYMLAEDAEEIFYTEPLYVQAAGIPDKLEYNGTIVTDGITLYQYALPSAANLTLAFRNGFYTFAYASQVQEAELYAYQFDFPDLQRENISFVSTSSSGMQWPADMNGNIKHVRLAAGDVFTFTLNASGSAVPYMEMEMDCSGLAVDASTTFNLTVNEAFTDITAEDVPLEVTVTKIVKLRDSLNIDLEEAEAPVAEETASVSAVTSVEATETPAPVPEETASPSTAPATEATPTAAPTQVPSGDSTIIGHVTVDTVQTVNIRASDSADTERIYVADPGERFEVTAQMPSGWYEIILPDGQVGYVAPKLVKFREAK